MSAKNGKKKKKKREKVKESREGNGSVSYLVCGSKCDSRQLNLVFPRSVLDQFLLLDLEDFRRDRIPPSLSESSSRFQHLRCTHSLQRRRIIAPIAAVIPVALIALITPVASVSAVASRGGRPTSRSVATSCARVGLGVHPLTLIAPLVPKSHSHRLLRRWGLVTTRG